MLVALAACAPRPVWFKPGATEADFESTKGRCIAGAYAQLPNAPTSVALGAGYQTPITTQCTATGPFANCTSSGGQYVPPPTLQLDANAGARDAVFKGCMYSQGFSLQRPDQLGANRASVASPGSGMDWTDGFNAGLRGSEAIDCDAPQSTRTSDWSLGCHSGQRARSEQHS